MKGKVASSRAQRYHFVFGRVLLNSRTMHVRTLKMSNDGIDSFIHYTWITHDYESTRVPSVINLTSSLNS
jgi:hypothetical protein